MNIKLFALLSALSGGLILVVAGEWFYARYAQEQLLNSLMTVSATDFKPDELPNIELAKQPETSYEDLVARPLFVKGRKPVEEPEPEQVNAPAPVVVNFDWAVTGIFTGKKGVSVLLSRAKSKLAKDNYRKIIVGEELDGWKLTEIGKDKVTFAQGSEQKELPLRKPKSKTITPKQPPSQARPQTPPAVPAPESPQEPPQDQPEVDTTEDTK